LFAANRADAGIVELQQVDAVRTGSAISPGGRGSGSGAARQCGDAFGRTRIADDRERLAGIDMERDAIDRGPRFRLGAGTVSSGF